MVARLLSALGDVASAQTIFRDTQAIFPLLRPEQGLVTAPDGRLFLEPVARFRVEPDVPDARLVLRLGANAIEGFHNLPLRFTVQVGSAGGAGDVESGEIVRAGDELAFSLAIPHRREATEILLQWRGSGERGALRTVAAPLAVQIIACELALAAVGAAPAAPVGANG
jgi:hypothetical protein